MTYDLDTLFEKNFASLWLSFLELEIKRSCEAVKFIGGARTYLVLQIICWHYFLVVKGSLKQKERSSIVKHWHKLSEKGYTDKNILTYSLISRLSGLSIETVRRHVKKLIDSKWVKYNKLSGVIFAASEENNKRLTDEFNIKELSFLKEFMNKVETLKNKDIS
tara:strand:+ start:302 stop:790 length:489 start_codon:yes stop_codon:yes gene_type:complete